LLDSNDAQELDNYLRIGDVYATLIEYLVQQGLFVD